MLRTSAVLAAFASLSLAGCAVDDDASIDVVDQSITTTGATYFSVRADLRRCSSPMCGGYFVSRLDGASTRCVDGKKHDECYVASLDAGSLELGTADLAALRGLTFTRGAVIVAGSLTKGADSFSHFSLDHAWVAGAAAGQARGEAASIADSGIRCITSPCSSLAETVLATGVTTKIAHLDFGPSGATEDEISRAWQAQGTGELIVLGARYTARINGRRALARRVNQFYVPFVAPSATVLTQEECESAGGFIRTDIGDGSTTCEPGETQLGHVAFGREGGVCCVAN